MHWFQEIVLSTFGANKSSRKGWATKNCPCCIFRGESADKRSRLGLKIDGDSFGLNCFNCGLKIKWKPGSKLYPDLKTYLLSSGLSEDQLQEINFKLYQEESLITTDTGQVSISSLQTIYNQWPEVPLPDNTFTIPELIEVGCNDADFISVLDYINKRKLYNLESLYWSFDKQYRGRIIIPFYYDQKLVGFTGRAVNNSIKIKKYLDNRPLDFVYNLNSQKKSQRKFVILTEGIIDAMHVDGITTFGNKLSDMQAKMINSLGKEIVLVPDYDKAGEDLIDIALKHSWKVSLPQWKFKDVSESVESRGKIITLRNILDSIEYKEFNVKLKWKMALKGRKK
jgi:hypothetical protein